MHFSIHGFSVTNFSVQHDYLTVEYIIYYLINFFDISFSLNFRKFSFAPFNIFLILLLTTYLINLFLVIFLISAFVPYLGLLEFSRSFIIMNLRLSSKTIMIILLMCIFLLTLQGYPNISQLNLRYHLVNTKIRLKLGLSFLYLNILYFSDVYQDFSFHDHFPI